MSPPVLEILAYLGTPLIMFYTIQIVRLINYRDIAADHLQCREIKIERRLNPFRQISGDYAVTNTTVALSQLLRFSILLTTGTPLGGLTNEQFIVLIVFVITTFVLDLVAYTIATAEDIKIRINVLFAFLFQSWTYYCTFSIMGYDPWGIEIRRLDLRLPFPVSFAILNAIVIGILYTVWWGFKERTRKFN
jgi:hypothetical protein